jgi:hypothetical protein
MTIEHGTTRPSKTSGDAKRVKRPLSLDIARRWARKFSAGRDQAVESIIAFGQLLTEGKTELDHGEWLFALETAKIDPREAEKCMRIANHPVLSNPSNLSNLPSALSSLDYLSGLTAEGVDVQALLDSHPKATKKQLKVAVEGPPVKERWSTPPLGVIKTVAAFFGGAIDYTADNIEQLSKDWSGRGAFVNPPEIGEPHITNDWVTKSKAEWHTGRVDEVVLWLPANTWTNWFALLLGEPSCSAWFSVGKLGGCPILVAYLGERRTDFTCAFKVLEGTVVRALHREQADCDDAPAVDDADLFDPPDTEAHRLLQERVEEHNAAVLGYQNRTQDRDALPRGASKRKEGDDL